MLTPDYNLMYQEFLQPEPLTAGMTSREVVSKAIEFDNSPRIPFSFVMNPNRTDLITLAIIPPGEPAEQPQTMEIGSTYVDRWGVTWEVTGRGWNHAIGHPLANLSKIDNYQFPDLSSVPELLKPMHKSAIANGKYIIAPNPIGMYETMRSLVGYEELMMAPYLQPDGLLKLLEKMTSLTVASIEAYERMGMVDSFMTWEDWGLQTTLQMKIDTFREFYKPFYKRIIDACHQHGMHFIWHNCGFIADMFPDMIELGVDVVQLDQPRLMGHRELIDKLGGKICMWNTVDIQWVMEENRTADEIRDEVVSMLNIYDVDHYHGGFIAKHYSQPWDIELSKEHQLAISNTFFQNGC